jgi:hypothetical protein
MGRTNKRTNGVFIHVIPQFDQPEYIKFITEHISNEKVKKYLNQYITTTQEVSGELFRLSLLETIIQQINTKNRLQHSDIKLNILRGYIYARTTFLRNDVPSNDIRVIVGNTETYGDNIPNLFGNKNFMNIANNLLTSAMDTHIQNNINNLNETD